MKYRVVNMQHPGIQKESDVKMGLESITNQAL